MDRIEKYAPLSSKYMPQRALLLWYKCDIQAAKRLRRYCERLWIRTALSVQYEIFKMARLYVTYILTTTNYQYYKNKIKEIYFDQEIGFSVLVKLNHC